MDYQNWTKDELEIKLLELEEEMNIVKDEDRLNEIISEINQIEKIMDLKKISILKANLNKTAKRFGYTWDKHKSQWKLNSKDEIEQDESATEKLGMRKKSHKLNGAEQYSIESHFQNAQNQYNHYVEYDDIESIKRCKITLMNLVREIEKIENDDKKSKQNGI